MCSNLLNHCSNFRDQVHFELDEADRLLLVLPRQVKLENL